MLSSNSTAGQPSPLLRLPVELRRLIYAYLLPHTLSLDVRYQQPPDPPEKPEYNLTFVRQNNGTGEWRMQKTAVKTGNDIIWRRASTLLLTLNRQIHEEAADMMYGDSTFVIDVTFDAINFCYRWRTVHNLTPSRTLAFLDRFSQRNLLRIRKYIINVESVDDYTGMIKYNHTGRGLLAGIRVKTQELVDQLAYVPDLHHLQIHLVDGAISRIRFPSGRVHRVQDEGYYVQTQKVLDPFLDLCGVRRVEVSGVSDEYAANLKESLTANAAPKDSMSL